MRVLTIFGTRPEAVKMAPVIQQLQHHAEIESRVCVTAQHREMLDQVLSLFHITPDLDLNVMRPNQSLAELTARILTDLDPVLRDETPDWVLVQGDTTTVMAAALLCYYRKIRVGHVEAGLRTYNKWQPFPEEVNRKIAGIMADLHFAPTEHSRQNLLREGVADWRIVLTGNPVIDALQTIAQLPMSGEINQLLSHHGILEGRKKLVLVTAHRRENFGAPLEHICHAIRRLADQFADQVQFVYPVHLNPQVQNTVIPLLQEHAAITLLNPLSYEELVSLEKHASLILTDSGGIQEEATAFAIPTLVLRNTTERPEGVDAGFLHLVGDDEDRIVREARMILQNSARKESLQHQKNPFGDGRAAARIVEALLQFQDLDAQAARTENAT